LTSNKSGEFAHFSGIGKRRKPPNHRYLSMC